MSAPLFPHAGGRRPFSARAGRHGVVLVLVLAFLLLISALILAFFASVTTELSVSKGYANGANAQQLADSAVEAVIGQIRLATASTNTAGDRLAWASQPGMIRSYHQGKPYFSYKLYSSDNMVVTGAPSFADDFDTGWGAAASTMNTARYTDLNEPVSGQFPIIDPRAAGLVGGYPLVDGFSYATSVTAGAQTIAIPGATATAGTTDTSARLPMPVKWIYLLKDGTLTVPNGGSGNTATWGTGTTTVPTTANPIVGRIAFWADDDTAKLNVNTACGGVDWETPHFTTGMEMAYSRYKPVANEFSRAPGHPATTSLLPVLWSFAGLTSPNTSLVPTVNPGSPMTPTTDVAPALSALASNTFQSLLTFSPRNAWGGSQMETVATTGYGVTAPPAFQSDADRLYASVDEALFAAPLSGAAPDSARIPTRVNSYNFTASDVEKLRFFLTADSRAPEMNPFNLPKVSMWPVPQSKPTPTDNLLAFCSTLNGNPYYFTRQNSLSSTADWTTRNDNLFSYLVNLWSKPVPAFGGSLEARYSRDGDNRLLTLIYDYIRSTINIFDTYGAPANADYTSTYPYSFMAETNNQNLGFGQITPIQITRPEGTYKGLGRFPGIKQVAIMFIAQAANQPPCLIGADGKPTTIFNPMHPWTSNPTSVTSASNGDGTYTITAPNAYPVISGQTHAGLPFLSNEWIDPTTWGTVLASPTTPANKAILAKILNPRYQGPAVPYGASDANGTNSQSLPMPAPAAGSGVLGPHMTQIQAVILVDPVDPAAGAIAMSPAFIVEITGMNSFQADSQPLGLGGDLVQSSAYKSGSNITTSYNLGMQTISTVKRTADASYAGTSQHLSFISIPVIVGSNSLSTGGSTFNFTGGSITVKIWAPNSKVGSTSLTPSTANATLVQTINLNFPSATFPTPLLPPMPTGGAAGGGGGLLMDASNPQAAAGPSANVPTTVSDLCPSSLLTLDWKSALASDSNFGTGGKLYATNCSHIFYNNNDVGSENYFLPERTTDPTVDYHAKLTADTVRSVEVLYGDTRNATSLATVPANFYAPHKFYNDSTTPMRAAHSFRGGASGDNNLYRGTTVNYLTSAVAGIAPAQLSLTGNIVNYDYYLHNTLDGRGLPASSPTTDILNLGSLASGSSITSSFPYVTSSTEFDDATFTQFWPSVPVKFSTVWANGGDFDTGIGLEPDGPTINKMTDSDESNYTGTASTNPDFNSIEGRVVTGYRSPQTFSPNRLVPSPVILGSLPVPVDNTNPAAPDPAHSWRTLLFCPNPASYDYTKGNSAQVRSAVQQVTEAGAVPSGSTAPDHLILDFFNMPVVAPYAISEPFSTAGKVNMNYQIAPFTYITRSTALRGVLRDSVVTAVSDQWMGNYKTISTQYANSGAPAGHSNTYFNFLTGTGNWGFRYPIDATDTLKQFDQRFSNNDLFRSPSEICSLWLYPATQPTAANPENPNTPLVTWDAANANIKDWWYDEKGSAYAGKSVTGDNVREAAYATLYPRLTTQSNTYTVHYRVQVLQKIHGSAPAQWVDGVDLVQGEYRGSSVIERYLDPSDTTLPDVAASASTGSTLPSFDNNYRYRVVSAQRFAP